LPEKLLTSHWQNNYQGSVRGLNTVGQKLAGALAD
jgi:Fe-Mn family superoxide dismutase